VHGIPSKIGVVLQWVSFQTEEVLVDAHLNDVFGGRVEIALRAQHESWTTRDV
jgi:hypothetical protein